MSDESVDIDIVVVGAGVVGLATAALLAKKFGNEKSIIVMERFFKFGQETSSHNSEVVHAGLYYKNEPLKAQHCLAGKKLLYDFCERFSVPYKKCGKLIVATSPDQISGLLDIQNTAQARSVPLHEVSLSELQLRAQNPSVIAGFFSPTTGIVDSHIFMEKLETLASQAGVHFLYKHELIDWGGYADGCHQLLVKDAQEQTLRVNAKMFINCAGLAADRVHRLIYSNSPYKTKACRGRYVLLSSKYSNRYDELIYPLPDPKGGLGVHITMDMSGACRLGPDVDWSFAETHQADDWSIYNFGEDTHKLMEDFLVAGQKLIPNLERKDMSEAYIGVRPKIYKNGELFKDFVIERGSYGDVHLLGIESPGLTAALSLAEEIANGIEI